MKRVLAVRLDNVGDVVMLGPALSALREAIGPDGTLTLLASPAGASVAPLLPWIDDVITWRAIWQDVRHELPLDPLRELDLVERLAARRFDAAVIFTSWSQSPWPPAYACYLAGIPIRAGRPGDEGGALLTNRAGPLADEAHQVDRNLHLLSSALGITTGDAHLRLQLRPEHRDEGRHVLHERGVTSRYAVVAPGASCHARRYPPPRFAEVATELERELGLPVVVVGSACERELLDPVRQAPGAVDLVGTTSLPALVAILEQADVAIVNDSGPMHLAAAVHTPLVALYSGSELESQWAPRGVPARVLGRPTACTPCHRFECPIGLPCLDIPVAEVVSAARELLATVGAPT